MKSAICKICGNQPQYIFNAYVLKAYDVEYFRCQYCDFIQTENPFWLEKAYSKAISNLDIGLVHRNIAFSDLIEDTLNTYWGREKGFLDYGGGYGLFVRLMRDKGFHFYRQDSYCENLFAAGFDFEELQEKAAGEASKRFGLITAFEVFEHLVEPMVELENMFAIADSVLFSTHLQPRKAINSVDDWWYFIPDTGQHIAFYSDQTLSYIAEYFEKNLYTNGSNLHLLCDKSVEIAEFDLKMPALHEHSLLSSDSKRSSVQNRHKAA